MATLKRIVYFPAYLLVSIGLALAVLYACVVTAFSDGEEAG